MSLPAWCDLCHRQSLEGKRVGTFMGDSGSEWNQIYLRPCICASLASGRTSVASEPAPICLEFASHTPCQCSWQICFSFQDVQNLFVALNPKPVLPKTLNQKTHHRVSFHRSESCARQDQYWRRTQQGSIPWGVEAKGEVRVLSQVPGLCSERGVCLRTTC